MKVLTKISMLRFLAAVALTGFAAPAFAETKCVIGTTRPCLAGQLPLYFADGDQYANANAGRCLERAREYKAWCRTPGQEVVSTFQVDGRNVISAHTAADGKSYVSDGLVRFTNFKD